MQLSKNNNKRNDICICQHSLIKHDGFGCHHRIFSKLDYSIRVCGCRKFRSAKAKEKM